MDSGNRIRMYGATIHRSTIELYPHGAGGESRTPDAMIMVAEMRFELIIFIPRTSGATIRHYHSAIQPKSCALPTELHPQIRKFNILPWPSTIYLQLLGLPNPTKFSPIFRSRLSRTFNRYLFKELRLYGAKGRSRTYGNSRIRRAL